MFVCDECLLAFDLLKILNLDFPLPFSPCELPFGLDDPFGVAGGGGGEGIYV